MSQPLADPLGHNNWANAKLLEFCRTLSQEQLEAIAPGTYGNVIDTLRHIISAEAGYRFRLTGVDPELRYRVEEMTGVDELTRVAAELADSWTELGAGAFDPDRDLHYEVKRPQDDGSVEIEDIEVKAGVLVAQVLNHGNEHRAQILTTLSTAGIEPPELDGWLYGEASGRAKYTFRAATSS